MSGSTPVIRAGSIGGMLRVDEAMRVKIRQRELTTLVPARPLEESARELLQQGLSNQAEYQRVFGL